VWLDYSGSVISCLPLLCSRDLLFGHLWRGEQSKEIYFQEFGLFFLYGACLTSTKRMEAACCAGCPISHLRCVDCSFFGHPLVHSGFSSFPRHRLWHSINSCHSAFRTIWRSSYGSTLRVPVQQTVAWLTAPDIRCQRLWDYPLRLLPSLHSRRGNLIERPALSFKPRNREGSRTPICRMRNVSC